MAANRGRHAGGRTGRGPGRWQGSGARQGPQGRRPFQAPGRIHKDPPPQEHADAPLEASNIGGVNRYEGGRFEAEDSHETTGPAQMLSNIHAMIMNHAEVLSTASANLKGVQEALVRLDGRVGRMEHKQRDAPATRRDVDDT